jgi:hypothetical protein
MKNYRTTVNADDDRSNTTEHVLKSAKDALWAIANMQITEHTDKSEVLEACMSIARIELMRCSAAEKPERMNYEN